MNRKGFLCRLFAGGSLLCAGCGGRSTSTSAPSCEAGTDGTPPPAVATTYSIETVSLTDSCPPSGCFCWSVSLPVDPSGLAACSILYLLQSGDSCGVHGLSQAPPDVTASITASFEAIAPIPPSFGPICLLPQIPASDWVGGSCRGSAQAGWCYLTGAASAPCAQSLAVSASGTLPSGAFSYLVCGEAPPSAPAQGTCAAKIGTPCTPSPELAPTFGGFDYRDVTVDENNAACSGAVCLVNHFQGLTGCPFGQAQDGGPPSGDDAGCTVPGTSIPVRPIGTQGAEVLPWCVDRQADDAVYCSCRCADAEGRTDAGPVCACPSGYACTQIAPAAQGGDPGAGAYCIKAGTAYDPNSSCATLCDPTTDACP